MSTSGTQRVEVGGQFAKYFLLRKLAAGGMGEIFLAKQQGPAGFEKLLVVKKILGDLTQNREFIELFLGEARLAARMNHRNIVQVFELGEHGGTYFIAMEYVAGKTLREVIDTAARKGERLHPEVCRSIAEQVCDGASYAHNLLDEGGRSLNIIHRDLNPQNVLISYGGDVKIIDFGIAKSDLSTVKTEAGMIKGKFVYMSPEQSLAKKLDKRSDVFSIGISFYEMLTGANPFHKSNIVLTLEAVQRLAPPPPSEIDPAYAPFDPIIARALAKDRDERYADAADMQDDLRRIVLPRAPERLGTFLSRLFRTSLEQEQKALAAGSPGLPGANRTPPKPTPTPVPEFRQEPPMESGGTLVLSPAPRRQSTPPKDAPAARPEARRAPAAGDTLLDASSVSPSGRGEDHPAEAVSATVMLEPAARAGHAKPLPAARTGDTVLLGSDEPAGGKTLVLGTAPARSPQRNTNGESTSILSPEESAAAQRSAMKQIEKAKQNRPGTKSRPRRPPSSRSLWFALALGVLAAVGGLVALVLWLVSEESPEPRVRRAANQAPVERVAEQARAPVPDSAPALAVGAAPAAAETPLAARRMETRTDGPRMLSQGKLYGTLTVNPQSAPVTFAGTRFPKQVGAYNLPVTRDSGTLDVGDASTPYAVHIDYRRAGSALQLKISTSPSATIWFNGTLRGASPANDVTLDSEQSLLELKRPGQPSGMSLRLQYRPLR